MRVVVQRVACAEVEVEGQVVGQIEQGLLVLVGFCHGDTSGDLDWMARKLPGLRVFEDGAEKMNLSLEDIGGPMLLVPQFTLYGDCRKGRRPSFTEALPPDEATVMFDSFCNLLAERGVPVERGVFGAHMKVSLLNDGPVTLVLDSP